MDDIGLKQTIMGSYFSDKMEVLNIQYHPQVSGDVERLSEKPKSSHLQNAAGGGDQYP